MNLDDFSAVRFQSYMSIKISKISLRPGNVFLVKGELNRVLKAFRLRNVFILTEEISSIVA